LTPKYGIVTKLPQNWVGILPQGTELFMLMSTRDQDGQILAMAVEDNIDQIRNNWENSNLNSGLGIVLQKSGDITERNGSMAAEFAINGNIGEKPQKGYAEAKCGDYGNCIVFLLICQDIFYESFKQGLQEFNDNTSFVAPSLSNMYQDFD
jgi:hypothetical protein